jgi:hypothetical protein
LEFEQGRGVFHQRRRAKKIDFTDPFDDELQIFPWVLVVRMLGFLIPADRASNSVAHGDKVLDDPRRIEKGIYIVADPMP